MAKQTLSAAQYNKRRSNICKVVGGGMILLSFVVQNYSYDIWNTRLTEYMNATRDYAAMQRTSLLYQNLYFSMTVYDSARPDDVRPALLQSAAKSDAVGRMILHEANEDREAIHEKMLEEIRAEVNSVKDYATYQAYLEKARRIDEFSLQQEQAQVKRDNEWKVIYRNVFLVTYVIGSVILLIGFRYE